MNRSLLFRLSLPIALFVLVLVFGRTPKPALAANAPTTSSKIQIVQENVTFNLPADTCSNLPAGVSLSGTGKRYAVITTRKVKNGKTQTIDSDFVVGTAQDSVGGHYNFLYGNQDRHVIAPNGKIQVDMTDTFTLSGNGGANNYTVEFHWRWTYKPPEEEWPPVHNWQKLFTLGDPLSCDPL